MCQHNIVMEFTKDECLLAFSVAQSSYIDILLYIDDVIAMSDSEFTDYITSLPMDYSGFSREDYLSELEQLADRKKSLLERFENCL